jgi:hypothetical protein
VGPPAAKVRGIRDFHLALHRACHRPYRDGCVECCPHRRAERRGTERSGSIKPPRISRHGRRAGTADFHIGPDRRGHDAIGPVPGATVRAADSGTAARSGRADHRARERHPRRAVHLGAGVARDGGRICPRGLRWSSRWTRGTGFG